MKTAHVEDLLARAGECDPDDPSDWDSFDENELRWLKDHNRLSHKVEQAKFRAVWDGGDGLDPGDREYLGDEGTRRMGFAAGIAAVPDEDLSGLPPGERRAREKAALQARIDQLDAEEQALASGGDAEDDVYEDMTVEDLKAEIDRRNEDYAAQEYPEGEQPFQLPKPSRKGQLVAVLREDDAADEDDVPE
jgi:hypothetical protein